MDKKVEKMKVAGKILGEVLESTLSYLKPGVTEIEVDKYAEELIRKKGGEPGFKKVPGYKHTICISTNDIVVHGIPTTRVLNKGDVVGIDCGVFLDGFHTDMAETVVVGQSRNKKVNKFLEAGKKAMFDGIKQAKSGNYVGNISEAMQEQIENKGGYSVVRSLVGHGVGRQLHEKPEIPGFLSGKVEKTPKLTVGMTIAIEIIYNMGKAGVVYSEDDDWTILTEDESLSGLFERTILVTEKGPKLLTSLTSDKL